MTVGLSRIFAAAMVMLLAVATQGAQAQITDPRVIALEEQVRQLNGQIEELNFQMLQMQDAMRRMQEDLEFRIQLLEEQQQGSLAPAGGTAPQTDLAANPAPSEGVAPKGGRLDNVGAQIAATVANPPVAQGGTVTGTPPRSLGTLTLGSDGQVLGAGIDFSKSGVNAVIDGAPVASVTLTGTPEDIYTEGYGHVLNGDYRLAAAVFESFVATYPDDPLIADAKFWLGESLLAQGRFEDAAEQFIDVRTNHASSGKGPQTMLKIGTIMAALGNRDVACATLDDALVTYPDLPDQTREAIASERQKAKC